MIQASFFGGPDGLRKLPFPGAVRAAAGVTAVPVPAERLRMGAPGGGQPLPPAVQSRMEAIFGADFSRVRVHVDERPAMIGALAFARGSDLHFAPGRYDPVSPGGQRLLAHELAHVVQQRAGRARNPFGSGVALVHDPTLEAEAERMALRAEGVAQPYFKIKTKNVYTSRGTLPKSGGDRALAPDRASFHAQVKGGKEFLAGPKAKIVSATRVTLRVSDDCQMAIEDTDLIGRQPKVFFATNQVFRASNAALKSVGSELRLAQAGDTVRIITSKGVEHVLRAVYPAPWDSWWARDRFGIRPNQSCNDLATSVIGIKAASQSVIAQAPPGVPIGVRTLSDQIHYTVADLVLRVLQKAETGFVYDSRTVATHEDWKSSEGERKMRKAIDRISREYAKAVMEGDADKLLQEWGINRHAAPGVGGAFVIHSVAVENEERQITDWNSGSTFTPPWPYHWGGVVAKSGTDVVTLENYARPGGEATRSADPRWYFQMYGQKRGQSFHEAWQRMGAFANPITLAMRNPSPKARRSPVNWNLILLLLVIVVLIAVGLLFFR